MSKNSIESVEKLIDIVKEYPVIYNKISVPSATTEDKNKAWEKIAKELNEDSTKLIKKKWRNLRDSYQKAIKSRRDLEEIDQLHRHKAYRHEARMSYLLPHIISEFSTRKRKNRNGYDLPDQEKPAK